MKTVSLSQEEEEFASQETDTEPLFVQQTSGTSTANVSSDQTSKLIKHLQNIGTTVSISSTIESESEGKNPTRKKYF